jgi:hypothetical protein
MHGYTSHLTQAGRFTRDQALDRCCGAMVGTAPKMGAMPELMVRLVDVQAVSAWYLSKFPDQVDEDWV